MRSPARLFPHLGPVPARPPHAWGWELIIQVLQRFPARPGSWGLDLVMLGPLVSGDQAVSAHSAKGGSLETGGPVGTWLCPLYGGLASRVRQWRAGGLHAVVLCITPLLSKGKQVRPDERLGTETIHALRGGLLEWASCPDSVTSAPGLPGAAQGYLMVMRKEKLRHRPPSLQGAD